MIVNIRHYLVVATILIVSTRASRVVSSYGGPIRSPSLPRRYSVSITTSVGGPVPVPVPVPATSPSPGPSPSPSPSPTPSPSPSKTKKPSNPVPTTPPSAPPPKPPPQPNLRPKQPPLKIPRLAPVNPTLKYLCTSTDYPSLCVSSLLPFLPKTGPIDNVVVLNAAIRASSAHAELAVSAFGRLISNTSYADEMVSAAVENCKDNYSDALDNLKSAASAIAGPTHDVWTANSMLSAVITDSENCEDGFHGVGESPVTEYNDKLRMLASNCLAIASLVQ